MDSEGSWGVWYVSMNDYGGLETKLIGGQDLLTFFFTILEPQSLIASAIEKLIPRSFLENIEESNGFVSACRRTHFVIR